MSTAGPDVLPNGALMMFQIGSDAVPDVPGAWPVPRLHGTLAGVLTHATGTWPGSTPAPIASSTTQPASILNVLFFSFIKYICFLLSRVEVGTEQSFKLPSHSSNARIPGNGVTESGRPAHSPETDLGRTRGPRRYWKYRTYTPAAARPARCPAPADPGKWNL